MLSSCFSIYLRKTVLLSSLTPHKKTTLEPFCVTSYMHCLTTNNTQSMCTAYFSSTEPLWRNPPRWLPPRRLPVHISFIFSWALPSPWISLLFQNGGFNYFGPATWGSAWRLSLQPAVGEYWWRWFVLMMGGDEGEMTKGGKTMRDRRRGGAVSRNADDEPQIIAQMKLFKPFYLSARY